MDKNNKAFKIGDRYSDYDCEVEVVGRTAKMVKLKVTYKANGKVVQTSKKPMNGLMDIWGTEYPMEYFVLGKNKNVYSVLMD